MNVATHHNASDEELARFGKLASRWWGEPGRDARCVGSHLAPASARTGMSGPAPLARDGVEAMHGWMQ